MTICVSTVSPRALDKLMEETVPAASVVPTRTRLDTTHTGNAAPDVVLNATRAVKTMGTAAANKKLLTRLGLPRTASPFMLADWLLMFIDAMPPQQSISWTGEEQNRKNLVCYSGISEAPICWIQRRSCGFSRYKASTMAVAL